MSSAVIQLLVLAGVAIFLILRLKSVLGTREGYEKPTIPVSNRNEKSDATRRDFEVIEGGPDHDIVDNVEDGSPEARRLAEMKKRDGDFSVNGFLEGARGAYEMILMSFEHGDLSDVKDFLSDDVYESFEEVIRERERQGLSVTAHFIGVREVKLTGVEFDQSTGEADLAVRLVGEMTSVVRNEAGEIVEGNPDEVRRQRDVWTFSRVMGSDDPNWQLVATGE